MLNARWWWSFIIITMNITYLLGLSIISHVSSESTNDYNNLTVYVLMIECHDDKPFSYRSRDCCQILLPMYIQILLLIISSKFKQIV